MTEFICEKAASKKKKRIYIRTTTKHSAAIKKDDNRKKNAVMYSSIKVKLETSSDGRKSNRNAWKELDKLGIISKWRHQKETKIKNKIKRCSYVFISLFVENKK